MIFNLILLGGLPGAGKTTTANAIRSVSPDSVVITAADDFHIDANGEYAFDANNLREAHKKCHRKAREAMAMGTPLVIVHNTFTQLWERQAYRESAAEFGYAVHDLVALNIHGSPNVHGVPDKKLRDMLLRMELPLLPPGPPNHKLSLWEVLNRLMGVPQPAKWHPEGDVYRHTVIVTGRALEANAPPEVQWAALFHDMGKLDTTRYIPELQRVIAYGHERASLDYVDEHADAIRSQGANVDVVRALVRDHMTVKYLDKFGAEKRAAFEAQEHFDALLELNGYDAGGDVEDDVFDAYEKGVLNMVARIQSRDPYAVEAD